MLGCGGRVVFSSKDINWEGDRIVLNMCKDGGGIVVGLVDFNKRLVVFLNICGGVDRGEVLKWEVIEVWLVKFLVVEIVIVSFVKKEYDYVI